MSDFKTISKRSMLLWTILVMVVVMSIIPTIIDYSDSFLARMDVLAKTDPEEALEETLAMLQLVFSVMALLLFCFGVYLVSCGRRSIRSQSFPPPQSWIIEGRRIMTGHAAERAGRLQVVVGYLLIAFALLILMIIWWVLARLPGLGGI